jgi:penicillin-binding protein 2
MIQPMTYCRSRHRRPSLRRQPHTAFVALLTVAIALLTAFVPTAATASGAQTDRPSTIDPALQALAERLLTGKQGSIVAIDPRSGEVRCLASHSFFGDSVNLALGQSYSPGSTFKTAQALTLLSEGVVTPETRFGCHKGFWHRNIHIGCHEHRSQLTLVEALGFSCNSWFCKAFARMVDARPKYASASAAVDRWHAYMSTMGLGRPLGIDLPGEVGGLLPNGAYLSRTHNGRWNGATVMWIGM